MEPGTQSNYHPPVTVKYTDIIAYVQEKYGVKIHGQYIANVKRLCGLEVQEGHYKPKNGKPSRDKKCPADKVEYIKDALRHFGILPGE